MLNCISLLSLNSILMSNSNGLLSSSLVLFVSSVTFSHEMLLDLIIESFVLLFLFLLFLLLSVLQFLTFLSIFIYELHSIEFVSEVGHLSLLCYRLEFLLLERHLLILLDLLILLEGEVPISNLFRLPVHDVPLCTLHFNFLFHLLI